MLVEFAELGEERGGSSAPRPTRSRRRAGSRIGIVRPVGRDPSSSRRRAARRCRRIPAGCRRGKSVSRPAMPIRGSARSVSCSSSSQPLLTLVSLLRNTTYWPRAASKPRLQVRTKPPFAALRTSRMPRPNTKPASIVSSREQSSTTIISNGTRAGIDDRLARSYRSGRTC